MKSGNHSRGMNIPLQRLLAEKKKMKREVVTTVVIEKKGFCFGGENFDQVSLKRWGRRGRRDYRLAYTTSLSVWLAVYNLRVVLGPLCLVGALAVYNLCASCWSKPISGCINMSILKGHNGARDF